MDKITIAIDPGASGGLAWGFPRTLVKTCSMPDTMPEIADKIRAIKAEAKMFEGAELECIIEQVGTYMPGNSGPAAATFARHCGHLEAVVYCLGIPTRQVLPKSWQKTMPLTKFPPIDKSLPQGAAQKLRGMRKAVHKNEIKDYVARRFPHLRVTLKTADALGIYLWAVEELNE